MESGKKKFYSVTQAPSIMKPKMGGVSVVERSTNETYKANFKIYDFGA
jgi:hypothetical protein